VGSQKLSEMLQQPYDLYKPGWADAYIMGLINQASNFFMAKKINSKLLFKAAWKPTYTLQVAL
jgi:hypothetical protein